MTPKWVLNIKTGSRTPWIYGAVTGLKDRQESLARVPMARSGEIVRASSLVGKMPIYNSKPIFVIRSGSGSKSRSWSR